MKDDDLFYLCGVIAGLSGVPVRVYRDSEQIYFSSVVNLPKDPASVCLCEIFAVRSSVGSYMTPQFLCYGVVRSGSLRVVMGPTFQVPPGDAELRSLAFLADVAPDDTEDFVSAMKSIVPLPPESMMQTLCAVNFVLCGEKVTLSGLTIFDRMQSDLSAEMLSRDEKERTQEPPADLHNTLSLEQTLMSIVQKGDTAALAEWAGSAPPIRGGVLAFDGLRQMKNTFIVTVTLASRAAIRGGLDAEEALLLSDRYIRRCEVTDTAEAITNLQFHMISDYTARVERLRIGREPSQLVSAVANYVRRHLSEAVTTGQIADALYISRTHLSARFRSEAGMTLSSYIRREKIEESKRLLRYTDKPLSAISSYLGFSSQSHFARVFRSLVGITPGEYRQKHAGH